MTRLIKAEEERLRSEREETNYKILEKKLQKLSSSKNRYLKAMESNLQVNMDRLVSKKKEGENIMRLRMRNLRSEAHRKLSQH